jgi:hypothetical protein
MGGVKKMNKSRLLIFSAAVIILAACGGGAQPAAQPTVATPAAGAGAIPARPVIRMSALGEEYDGLPGAYCWLQAPNDIRCEPAPLNPEPDTAVSVALGDVLTFTIEDGPGLPGAFYATLLGEEDADGDPLVINLGSANSAEYTVNNLNPGTHRFSVVAEYPDVGGDNSFVTSIFAVEVPTSVVAAVTPRPTATTPPTPVVAATGEPTEAQLQPTKAETEETLPTAEPTEVPTAVPTLPPSPTVVLPTPTTAPPPVLPTNTPASNVGVAENPPAVAVINGGRQFLPDGTRYCYRDANEREVCVDAPASGAAERILVGPNTTLRIDAEGSGPYSMVISLYNSDLSQQLQRQDLPGSNVSLYTVIGEPGNYVLVIDTVWPESTATYYFRLQIVG